MEENKMQGNIGFVEKESFFKELRALLVKHKCNYLEVENASIGGLKLKFDYFNDGEGQESMTINIKYSIGDCAAMWGKL